MQFGARFRVKFDVNFGGGVQEKLKVQRYSLRFDGSGLDNFEIGKYYIIKDFDGELYMVDYSTFLRFAKSSELYQKI